MELSQEIPVFHPVKTTNFGNHKLGGEVLVAVS